MQQKNIMQKKSKHVAIEWAKTWLACVVLIGVVSSLTSSTCFADPPPAATYSFDGLSQSSSDYLPRTNGAVGRNYVMTPLSDDILFQDKLTGNHVGLPLTEADFWDGLDCGIIWPCDPAFQPAVVFDPSTNRWFFVARDKVQLQLFYIGASKKEDPRDPTDWYKWVITELNGVGVEPQLGFSNKWVGVVLHTNITGDSFEQIYVFDKASLLAGNLNYKSILGTVSQAAFMCPARTYDPDVSDLFLLQSTKNPEIVGGINDRLTYYKLHGDSVNDVQLSSGTEVIAPAPWGVLAWDAPQLAGPFPNSIRHDNDRIHNCIFRNGCLWTAHTVALPADTGGQTAYASVQWWQIKPGTGSSQPTIVQIGVIGGPPQIGGDGNFRAFPTLAVNANDNVLIGYGLFGSTFYPSGAYSFRFGTDPVNSMRSDGTCGIGTGPFLQGPAPFFWGNRSAAVIDPVDDRSMWTIQEFTGAPEPTAPPDPPAEPETPGPRLWATHWIGLSINFGRFVAGQGHSLGLDPVSMTALAASGRNTFGQLGNGNNTNVNSPVSVGGSLPAFALYKILDATAGLNSSLAVDLNGSVFAWGANTAGQLGAGFADFSPHSTPAAVPCASPLPCWNGKFTLFKRDADGQPYYVPVSTGFGIGPSIVSFKVSATAAVDYLGRVWMWGLNSYGQLGDGTTTSHYTPALVTEPLETPAFDGVASIETAPYTTIALKADRSVWSWGSGCSGVLGDGDTSCLSTHYVTHPQQVLTGASQPLTGVVQVACGRLSDFCLALTQDGTVYGWGANGSYQLGLDDTLNRGYATLIPNFGSIRRVAAGGYHSLALASDGRVYAWGQGGYGQTGFGNASGRAQSTPRLMEGTNSQYTDIAAGNNFSLMIRGNAQPPQVLGTGDNSFGQLATGSSTSMYTLPTPTLY